ncbi:uncharacterized protein [Arachis hypogaea]|uniref:uncharacterized protein n=1 Tax=Arachis hypogaea TaxID=3818 RepID=UPI003B226BB0
MEKLLDIMFYHGRTFKKNADGKLVYSPDNKACLGDLDENRLDVFFIRNYFKELGYDKVIECWWLVPERSLEYTCNIGSTLGVHLHLKQPTVPIRQHRQLTFHPQCLDRKLKRLNYPNQAMVEHKMRHHHQQQSHLSYQLLNGRPHHNQ